MLQKGAERLLADRPTPAVLIARVYQRALGRNPTATEAKACRDLLGPTLRPEGLQDLLWAVVMFCYVYGDYFGLFKPGAVQHMLQGRMDPLGPVTQPILVFTSAMMVIPSVMVFLSVALPARGSRWLSCSLTLL